MLRGPLSGSGSEGLAAETGQALGQRRSQARPERWLPARPAARRLLTHRDSEGALMLISQCLPSYTPS